MKVDVSAKLINIPRHCACCTGLPDVELRASASKKRGKTQLTNSWSFPYCSQCASHIQRYKLAIGVLIGGLVVAVAGMLFYSRLCAMIALFGIGACILLVGQARAMRGAACACTGAAVSYLGWHGTLHSFDFVSQVYAVQFMRANRGKLVNLTPSQHQMLGGAGSVASAADRHIHHH